jgi:NagD protein
MLRAARKEIDLDTDQTVVIGDTMETDILGGAQVGYHTILVLSGGTRQEDVHRYPYEPDMIVNSIADIDHNNIRAMLEKKVISSNSD